MRLFGLLILLALPTPLLAFDKSIPIHHTVVHQEEGRFAGWPANQGIWSWGDEIVVGYTLSYHKKNPTGGHDIDPDRPGVTLQGRSLDGGETWVVESLNYPEKSEDDSIVPQLIKPIDFSNPHLAIKLKGSTIAYSNDRCRTWLGPYQLPTFGRQALLARTDYMVEGPKRVTAFVAASKEGTDSEGQPLCIRTDDGGLTWKLVGWIGPQPPLDYGYGIMPATVRIGETGYLSMIRRGGVFDGRKRWWVEPYLSHDDGSSWYLLNGPVIENSGNPATLTRLKCGSIAMAYGWRRSPYGLRARISSDDGQTWSREKSLRHDGTSWDIGYPRTVQRPDGKCVTVYYYHNTDAPERFMACTIWDPEQL